MIIFITRSFLLIEHRQESNRIVREFIFGSTVTHFISQGIKSEEYLSM